MNINHLSISWSVSRGRDTYGYNICRLDDRNGRQRFRTCGGGYDMIGTVFGQWLSSVYQDRLMSKAAELMSIPDASSPYGTTGWVQFKNLYGMVYRPASPDGKSPAKVSLDGACGIESMRRIAESIGLEVEWEGNRKGHTIGYFIQDNLA